MKRAWTAAALVAVLMAASPAAAAEILSKNFVFKAGTVLEMGTKVDEGLRLDQVQFKVPARSAKGFFRLGGLAKAEVRISNTGERSRKVGIAIALFDSKGRLVGVASGGSKFLSIKPGRQSYYTLVFEDVNSGIPDAAKFTITVEPRN